MRALATGDVDLLQWRATHGFKQLLARRVAQRPAGYRVVGPVIDEEHSVKPRIVHSMPTSGQLQITVRFRTTQARRTRCLGRLTAQSLQVFDDRGDYRPELSSEGVPVLQVRNRHQRTV